MGDSLRDGGYRALRRMMAAILLRLRWNVKLFHKKSWLMNAKLENGFPAFTLRWFTCATTFRATNIRDIPTLGPAEIAARQAPFRVARRPMCGNCVELARPPATLYVTQCRGFMYDDSAYVRAARLAAIPPFC
jgi:hypothetical protein